MRHPTDGTLRRLVDEPAGVADADREHVAGCPVCLSGLAAAREDAAVTGAALGAGFATDADVDADVDAAWRRLSAAMAAQERGAATAAPARRWRAALRSPVVAAFGVAALLTGAGAAAAADWLQIFRTEQIAPVTAPRADLVKLPDLSAFGELQVTEEVRVREVAGAAAAQQASGLSIPQVSELPRGVTGEPAYHVGDRVSAVFTFSAGKAAQAAAAAGKTAPPPPPGLDGSRFRLAAGPGLAAVWSQGRPVPALIVARVVPPTAESSGISFETARDYLLSLRVLPENVASRLRGFSGEGTTLPLFTAAERVTSTAADVGGAPATVLTSRDGTMAGVVWMRDGVITAVAGSLSADEVLSVARGLRWDR
ncbi:hypothetical protein HNP84_005211 [Thermocatellispora tengchongensis]|uniref:DUF4367 domain-containing protein n=1 Tax=Thermocatellispora tengchongensis TaxID=1073253 RepID=A0A840PE95_9ACTN|nr:hypothetical protein [Thermocatellispora tengchongensis]MBB5135467.1 hypothetical protein [Thermocatellispora tengchongensis]